jgi:tetratricopeptide (TPR) repeat protein
MDPELQAWREAKRVFDRIVHLPPGRQHARLHAMSLGHAVRERVRQLLQAQHEQDRLLDTPCLVAAPGARLVGRRLGRWTLDAELGRGGTAVVYRAHATLDGAERIAALKLVTIAGLARGGSERFRQEQRILARLNHPHIAPLFEAGEAEDGTPWFAMALVDGEPIDTWCATRRLAPRAIVALLLDLCDAVAYAHRNLVIHRDIKPSNVLVDQHGHVRLLDFGIARLADEAEPATAPHARVLTPLYAAPEQFDGAPPGTAMDVYGLGALLYRLLTGHAPRGATTEGEREPPPPSRIAEPDARGVAPLRRELRGDLDAILLKALRAQPEQRYAGASDLADDLRRWLRDEPVAAARAGRAYRWRKFARRHRVALGVAAALTLTAALGVGATLRQSHEAQRQAAHATAARDFVVNLFQDVDPQLARKVAPDPRTLLANGARRVRVELAQQPALRAELLQTIGTIQSNLGEYAAAREALEEARGLADAGDADALLGARSRYRLGVLDHREGRYRDALAVLDTAIAALQRSPDLGGEEARSVLLYALLARSDTRKQLDDWRGALADLDQAERLDAGLVPVQPRRRAHLAIARARLLRGERRYAEARDLVRAGLALVGEPMPADYTFHIDLASLEDTLGDPVAAEASYRRAWALVDANYPEGSVARGRTLVDLATFLADNGRAAEADPLFREALRLLQAQLSPDNAHLGAPLYNYGRLLFDLERRADALAALERARAITLASAGARDPRTFLIEAMRLRVFDADGDAVRADALALDLQRELDAYEAGGGSTPWLGSSFAALARHALAQGRADEALALLERGARHAPPVANAGSSVVLLRALRVEALLALARDADAAAEARVLRQEAATLVPSATRHRGEILATLAREALRRGDAAAARRFLDTAAQHPVGAAYPAWVERGFAALRAELAGAAAVGDAPPRPR